MRSVRNWFGVCLTLVSMATAGSQAQEKTVVVRPQDTGEALANPGMGWVLHHYDNIAFNYGGKLEPSDTVDDFPGVTTVYLRIAWSHQAEEGRFVWSVLDTPAQRWLDKGKQIALRISCSESFMRYATPQWVEKAGDKTNVEQHHPLRRRVPHERFAARDSQGDLLAFVEPSLGGRVEHGPDESAFFGLEVRPGDSQVDHRHTREIIDSIGRFELAAVVEGDVVIVVQDPTHAGIGECLARVLGADHNRLLRACEPAVAIDTRVRQTPNQFLTLCIIHSLAIGFLRSV